MPNHYAHEICIEIRNRTPILKSTYVSPGPQNHMKNSEYSSLARMSTWSFIICPFHIIFSHFLARSKRGIPKRDIWFLCVMVQGPHQIWRVVGTSPPSPPSSFFQEHVPKMDSFANVLDSKELLSISRFPGHQNWSFSSISRLSGDQNDW